MKLDSSNVGLATLKVVILLVIATTYRIDLIGKQWRKTLYCSFLLVEKHYHIREFPQLWITIPEKLKATLAQFTEIKKEKFNESLLDP